MIWHRSAIFCSDWYPWARGFLAINDGIQKAGYPHLPVPLSEAFHSPTSERTESEYPRRSVYHTPKSVREGTISPRHTPGVYTTPVASTSAVALDWFICIVEVSDSQKQSINDAFQYVAVPPIRPETWVWTTAKLQIFCYNTSKKFEKVSFML